MTIKGLLTHFDNENNLILQNIKYNNRIDWQGVAKDLKMVHLLLTLVVKLKIGM